MRAMLELVDVPTTTIPEESGVPFVAIGRDKLITSPDGTTWTEQSHGLPSGEFANPELAGAFFGAGTWVVVGGDGEFEPAVITSVDGENWTRQTVSSTFGATEVVFGGGVWVGAAAGSPGVIVRSIDAQTWTEPTPPTGGGSTLIDVTYGDGTFVIVGADRCWTSPDGETWTAQTPPGTGRIEGVTYGDGRFVAVHQSHDEAYVSTDDGETWDDFSLPSSGEEWYHVHFADGQFVAVGELIATSPDGETWTQRINPTFETFSRVTFAQGLWVAVGSAGAIITSADGVTWTEQTSPVSVTLRGVAGAT